MNATSRINSVAVGVLCGIGASLFWAAGFAATRAGLDAGFTPADLTIHRYLWPGFILLPLVIRAGIGDLNGIGWGRGVVLALLGGPGFAVISYAGFLLVPLGHGGVIQPACATFGGLLLATYLLGEKLGIARVVGTAVIIGGLAVIGAEALTTIGMHGIAGDLIFVLTGLMYATFGIMLRLWRIAAMPAAAAVCVLSIFTAPVHWLLGGFDHMAALGWQANIMQAVLQGLLMGPAVTYLFVRAVQLLGAGRATVFPSLVPPFVLLIGWLALGEIPTALQLTGMAVVLIGFRVAQRAAG